MTVRRELLGWLVTIAVIACVSSSQLDKLTLPSSAITLCSDDGFEIFNAEDTIQHVYHRIISQSTTMEKPNYSGIASSVMILNAIQFLNPPPESQYDYNFFTQNNFFSEDVAAIKTPSEVQHSGLTIDELAQMLDTWKFGWRDPDSNVTTPEQIYNVTSVIHASEGDIDEFRSEAEALLSFNGRILISYSKAVIAQNEKETQFSPILAYSPSNDMFLVFDVVRYEYSCPAFWLSTNALWDAMTLKRSGSKTSEGYIFLDVLATAPPEEDEHHGTKIFLIIMSAMFYVTVVTIAGVLILIALYNGIRQLKSGRKHTVAVAVDNN